VVLGQGEFVKVDDRALEYRPPKQKDADSDDSGSDGEEMEDEEEE
jgi:hypothetical protein